MAPSREDTTTTMTHMSPNSCCISGAGYWSVFSQYHRLIINCSSLLIRKPIVFSTGELLPEFLQFKRWRKVKLERRSTSVELLCPSTVGVTSRQLFNDGLPVWGPLYCYLRPSLYPQSLLSTGSVEAVLFDIVWLSGFDTTLWNFLGVNQILHLKARRIGTSDTFVLRILKLLCSGMMGCSRWRCRWKFSPDGSWTSAESWNNHTKQTLRISEGTNWTEGQIQNPKAFEKSLDVGKWWEAEGVTIVQEKSHWMWLVWWPGVFSPRPLQPPSDQWWGGAPTAPNSLSLNDERACCFGVTRPRLWPKSAHT